MLRTCVKLSVCVCVCVCHEGKWGSGGVAPLIFNFSTRWRWVVSFLLYLLYLWAKEPLVPHWVWDWVCFRSGLDTLERRKPPCWTTISRMSDSQPSHSANHTAVAPLELVFHVESIKALSLHKPRNTMGCYFEQ